MLMRIMIILSFQSLLFGDGVRYVDEIFDEVIKTEDVVYGMPLIFLFGFGLNPIL